MNLITTTTGQPMTTSLVIAEKSGDASERGLREGTLLAASATPENRLLGAKVSEGRIGSASRLLKRLAAAVVASVAPWVVGFKRIQLVLQHPQLFVLLCFAFFMRRYLPFKIRCLALKCRVLRLDESQVLAKDRRRAMLIDQFFNCIEQPHSNSPY